MPRIRAIVLLMLPVLLDCCRTTLHAGPTPTFEAGLPGWMRDIWNGRRPPACAGGRAAPATPLLDVARPSKTRVPVCFEANHGQSPSDAIFLARATHQLARIGVGETTLVTSTSSGTQVQRFRLVGACARAMPVGRKKLPGSSNYFIGNRPDQWRTDIPQFAEVAAPGVYPGIDLIYHSNQGRIEYDFHIAPGADARDITLEFPDVRELSITPEGELLLHPEPTGYQSSGAVRKSAPVIYQDISGRRVLVQGAWELRGPRRAGYTIAAYDPRFELVIDPIIYSTYVGGTLDDTAQAAAVDAAGNVYVTGFTLSANFPLQGAFQPALSGTQDLFVCKMNPAGTALLYSTYLGGSAADGWINGKQGIVVDSGGNAIITAGTPSNDYPMKNAAQAAYGGGPFDTVITKLNPAGSALVFSTYLGGSAWDLGYGIAVDGTDAIYVTGLTSSLNFPTTAGAFQSAPGGGAAGNNDAFVAKYSPAGVIAYATYLGGTGGNEWGRAIAVRGSNAYVIGVTDSPNFPTTAGALQTTIAGNWDIFVTQLDAAGAMQVYSTYLGGNQLEDCWGICLDAAGNAYLGCRTDSANFPITPGAAQTAFGGGTDGAIVKLNPAGTALVYSTFLGGSAVDEVRALAIDAAGNAYVTGFTLSANFPAVNTLQGAFGGGGGDAFVAVLNPAGSAWRMSSWLGGSGPEGGVGIGLDAAGNFYVAGSTNSINFPTLTPMQAANAGAADVFIAKLTLPVPAPPPAGTLFGITILGNQLITINTTTGAGTLLGPLSSNMQSFGIAFRGAKLYAWDDIATRLRELNPATAATINTINIGAIPGGEGDIVFRSDGIGFLSAQPVGGQLFRFDSTVPNSTLIGVLNPPMDGLAFNSAGVLYGLNNGGTALYTIDQTTGATTLVGNTGILGFTANTSGGLAFDAAGNLYAALSNWPPGPSSLFHINTSTGAGTLVGNIGFQGVSGLAFSGNGGGGSSGGGNSGGGGVGEGSYQGSGGPPGGSGSGEGSFGFGGGGFSFSGRTAARPSSGILIGPATDASGFSRYRVNNIAYRRAADLGADSGFGAPGWSLLFGLALAIMVPPALMFRKMRNVNN